MTRLWASWLPTNAELLVPSPPTAVTIPVVSAVYTFGCSALQPKAAAAPMSVAATMTIQCARRMRR